MRILFVVSEFPSLSETFILDQITGLMSRGHDVSIFASKASETAISHSQVEEFNLLGRTIYSLTPQSGIVRALHALPLLLRTVPINGVRKLAAMNFFRYGSYAASLRLFYDAVSFPERSDFDIIHCHFGPNGNRAALLKNLGVLQGKLVTTFHGYDLSLLVAKHGPKFYSRLFSTGDLFLPISEHWRRRLIELGCDQSRIMVHRMGIECAKFAFTTKQIKPNGPIRLVSIARLVEKKGIEYAVRAWEHSCR